MAKEDIQPMEAFLYVPQKCWISLEHAKTSEIGVIFRSHDSLFVGNYCGYQLIICTFLMYEKNKGENSFWHPYIDYLESGVPTCYWS